MKACFYYRPYSGQVESLSAGEWKRTAWVRVEPMAPSPLTPRELKKLRQFEYRAVLEYRQVEISGENMIF